MPCQKQLVSVQSAIVLFCSEHGRLAIADADDEGLIAYHWQKHLDQIDRDNRAVAAYDNAARRLASQQSAMLGSAYQQAAQPQHLASGLEGLEDHYAQSVTDYYRNRLIGLANQQAPMLGSADQQQAIGSAFASQQAANPSSLDQNYWNALAANCLGIKSQPAAQQHDPPQYLAGSAPPAASLTAPEHSIFTLTATNGTQRHYEMRSGAWRLLPVTIVLEPGSGFGLPLAPAPEGSIYVDRSTNISHVYQNRSWHRLEGDWSNLPQIAAAFAAQPASNRAPATPAPSPQPPPPKPLTPKFSWKKRPID
jgi:hypothetical protein